MASVASESRKRSLPPFGSNASGPRGKGSQRPRLSLPSDSLLHSQNRGPRPASVQTQTVNSAPNTENRRGSKRRVTDSTPACLPRNKKRPRSEGDTTTARTLNFSPYQQIHNERGLETLSQQIWNDYFHMKQTPDRYEQKLHLRDYLLSIFITAYPGCSLHICGSTCTGLATNGSDVDLCLLLSETRKIDQRFEARRILHQLNTMLRRSPYVQRCQVIHAKVPILKFRDSKSGCECDVNINNTVGIKNTHLLQGYCGYDWRVQPLIMIIKKWAKRHGINDASKGTLSSYSIVMMVIHFLQDPCNPPVVPVLQDKYPEIFNASRNIQDLSLENPCLHMAPERSVNQESLGQLLLGFFRYYAEEFSWDKDVICIRRGMKYPRGTSETWVKKYICIEEPFDFSCVARAVHTQEKFDEIKQRIRIAYYTLTVSPFIESILSGS